MPALLPRLRQARWLPALSYAALGALAFAWLLHLAALAELMNGERRMNDFGRFYYSARMFLDGDGLYGESPATLIPVGAGQSMQFWNLNPPHFHLIVLPLARLAERPALLGWVLLNILALAFSLRRIARSLGLRWTREGILWVGAVLVFSAASGALVVTGQLTLLLLLPVTFGWSAARGGNFGRAGVWLGAAASVKPFLGVFAFYFVARRQFRPLVSMVAVAGACFAVGIALFGWRAHTDWIAALGATQWTWAAMNGSLTGLLARSLGPSPYYTPVVHATGAIIPATLTLGTAVLAFSLVRLVRAPAVSVDTVFGGLLLTALLVSPVGWVYYLPLVAGPGSGLWIEWRGRPSTVRRALLVAALPGLVCPLTIVGLRGDLVWYTLSVGSAYAWTTLCLWAAVFTGLQPDRRPRPPPTAEVPLPTEGV